MSGFRQPGRQRELVVVTATTIALTAHDAGKTICNVGAAGALTATLPAAATCRPGDDIWFLSCADQTFTVAGTAGELIVLNDVAANSVALSTSSEKAGGAMIATCVSGSKWHIAFWLEETQTATVAT